MVSTWNTWPLRPERQLVRGFFSVGKTWNSKKLTGACTTRLCDEFFKSAPSRAFREENTRAQQAFQSKLSKLHTHTDIHTDSFARWNIAEFTHSGTRSASIDFCRSGEPSNECPVHCHATSEFALFFLFVLIFELYSFFSLESWKIRLHLPPV